MVIRADVSKEISIAEDVDGGLIVQKDVQRRDGEIVPMESFVALAVGGTPASPSCCGKGILQVAPGRVVGDHRKTFKNIIRIGVYLEIRHESVHVVVGCFLGADVCMCLGGLGLVRALVGKVAKFLTLEALDLAEVPRLLLVIIGVRLAVGKVIVTLLLEDDGSGRRA